jgi:hypothetical protein
MLIDVRRDSCLTVKTVVASLASCATIPGTTVNPITFSGLTTCSRLVSLVYTLFVFTLLVHTCSPNQIRCHHEVALPYAFDLRLPDWQKWLKESKDKLRDAYHEEVRREAEVRNPLWSYELKIDHCDSSY